MQAEFMKAVIQKEWKRKHYWIDVQSSTDEKLATTQDRQVLQNSDEKQYSREWILKISRKQRLLVKTLNQQEQFLVSFGCFY